MPKRIGLIQTRGIGDIIIALPIADHFIELGYEVVWPIDADFVRIFAPIKPEITFLPVQNGPGYFFHDPVRLIGEHNCERTIILYSYLSDLNIFDTRLSGSLKFDEYKYAIAGVPFSKKWDLKYKRDMAREQALFDSLKITGDYVCFHGQSSDMPKPLVLPERMADGLQIINLEKMSDTESPFDWLLTFERAKKLILIDSCFANLVEQMNLAGDKCIIVKNTVQHTPVFKNGWQFMFPSQFERG